MKLLLLTVALWASTTNAATAILPVDSSSVSVHQTGKDFAYTIQQDRGALAVQDATLVEAAPQPAAVATTADVVAVAPPAAVTTGARAVAQTLIENEQAKLKEKNEAIKTQLRAQTTSGTVLTGGQLIEKGHLLGLRGVDLRNLQVELFPTYIIPRYYYDIYDLNSPIPQYVIRYI